MIADKFRALWQEADAGIAREGDIPLGGQILADEDIELRLSALSGVALIGVEAEAEARRLLAEALKLYNDAGLSIEALKVLPEIAAAVSEPLARAGQTTIISNGAAGDGTGASVGAGVGAGARADAGAGAGASDGADAAATFPTSRFPLLSKI